MNTQSIEIETLKQLELMNKVKHVRPSLMMPKHYDGALIVTNSHVAIKVSDEKYREDNREDYPTNALQLFEGDAVEWIDLSMDDMKSLKEFASTFKRLKETNIIITFDRDSFTVEGYNNKIKTSLPYQKITYSGDMVGKNIMINPKYLEQILAYYIKLKAANAKLEWYGDKQPIKITSNNVQYLACQIRTPR